MCRLMCLCLPVLVLFSGCGAGKTPQLGVVKGTVTLDGQPLSGVNVLFQPESGRPSQGRTDSSGKYELEYLAGTNGVLIGRHTVRIAVPEPDDEEDAADRKQRRQLVPAKYNISTELSAEVKPGRNTIDFALESK